MKTNQEYKNIALASLKGKWAPAVVATIAFMAIIYVIIVPYTVTAELMTSRIPVNPIVAIISLAIYLLGIPLVLTPLSVGYTYAANRLYVEGDSRLAGNMFKDGFGSWGRNVWGMFIVGLYATLWSFLLIVPGIIKFYAYAMTPYILIDNPELPANQAIYLSKKMMKGHKFDLFILQLSFIGWGFLSIFTLGIGLLWVVPYMMTAQAAFYQDIRKEYQSTNNQ